MKHIHLFLTLLISFTFCSENILQGHNKNNTEEMIIVDYDHGINSLENPPEQVIRKEKSELEQRANNEILSFEKNSYFYTNCEAKALSEVKQLIRENANIDFGPCYQYIPLSIAHIYLLMVDQKHRLNIINKTNISALWGRFGLMFRYWNPTEDDKKYWGTILINTIKEGLHRKEFKPDTTFFLSSLLILNTSL